MKDNENTAEPMVHADIVVTQAMLEAGMQILMDRDEDEEDGDSTTYFKTVERIYQAMVAARSA